MDIPAICLLTAKVLKYLCNQNSISCQSDECEDLLNVLIKEMTN